ncbi:Uncharacterized protein PCOAH_00002270 [Plasmodium coatneyi]|uniref:KIR protein n=1 Tax=Plasmodium coatneyi TaxID=208452 RepID=A0A1B1DT22_9APIC|nr:Uncharacterized protein PCOAH_00002270 [Plasmodium coatneyi]ANQ05923.1 Uncharacterized protein PCOAH_00002270 [Plasmodium coatneyi]
MEDPSEELPSQVIYAAFGRKEGECQEGRGSKDCKKDVIEGVGGALGVWNRDLWLHDRELATAIVRSYYSARIVQAQSEGYYKPCHFFYYWLGDRIRGNLNRNPPVSTLMNSIYSKLKNFPCGSECKRECTHLYKDNDSWEIFTKGKKVFDYYYDYDYLQRHSENEACSRISNYDQYREVAQTAYTQLCNYCKTNSNDYCRDFEGKYMQGGKCKNTELPKLECSSSSQLEPEDEEDDDESCSGDKAPCPSKPTKAPKKATTIQLTKAHLERLNSYLQYYKKFKDSKGYCNYSCFPRVKIRDAIKTYFEEQKYATVVANALCYVSTKIGMEKEPRDPFCNFLYYWLGHLLYKKLTNSTISFSTVIEAIKKELNKIPQNHKCELQFSNLSEANDFTTLNYKQIVYEYFIDRAKIEQNFSRAAPKPASTPSCTKKYKAHLENITKACSTVTSYCKGDGKTKDPSYCNEFDTNYKSFCEEEGMSKLQSVKELTDDQTTGCTEELSGEATTLGNNTSTTTAISSILGVAGVGVPAIAAFLYKYKPWYSWFGNNTSGNGRGRSNTRKRRSSTHNFRSSTEDTLTTYSTENSTIGPTESSTIDGIVPSTPYTRQPNRGGKTNNSTAGRGMVGYQNM